MTNIEYTNKENDKGVVLDSPLKDKTTETCVVEGTMSVVQPTPKTGRASGHLSIF